jgi:EpsI family protein
MPGNKPTRILTVVLLLQAVLFYATSRAENVPTLQPLRGFSGHFAGWLAVEEGYVDDETNAVLKADDTLIREYANAQFPVAANLFVAFFMTQRTGKAPHSPKNCLPGAGWEASTSDFLSINVPGAAAPIVVNRYIVSKGDNKSLVLYWYQTQKRVVASEFKAKILTVTDSISQNRTDTALVRVIIPVVGNNEARAQAEAIDFVQAFFGPLRAYLPA